LYHLSRICLAFLVAAAAAACGAEDDVESPAPATAAVVATTVAPATTVATAEEPATTVEPPAEIPTGGEVIEIEEEWHAEPLPRAEPVVLESPVPATRKAVDGHVYLVEEAIVDGARRDLYAPILLHFDGGRVLVETGCNLSSTTYTLEGDRISPGGEEGTTLMLCEEERMAQDEWVGAALHAAPSVLLDGVKIELRTDDVVLRGRDREVANPDFPLAGRSYRIAAFVGGESGRRTEAAWMQQSEVRFAPDGALSVRAPCGSFEGAYRVEADRLSIDFALDGPCFADDDEVADILAWLWTNPPQPHWLEGDEHRVVATSDMDGSQLELVAID
jgi:heat shock protein HslJ